MHPINKAFSPFRRHNPKYARSALFFHKVIQINKKTQSIVFLRFPTFPPPDKRIFLQVR
jgi:hypothetical protein